MPHHRQSLVLTVVLAVCGAAASSLLPSAALAHDPMYPKIGFHFRLAAGGDVEGRAGNGPTHRAGMEPGFGGGVELEVPLNVHFPGGGAFEAYGWNVGTSS